MSAWRFPCERPTERPLSLLSIPLHIVSRGGPSFVRSRLSAIVGLGDILQSKHVTIGPRIVSCHSLQWPPRAAFARGNGLMLCNPNSCADVQDRQTRSYYLPSDSIGHCALSKPHWLSFTGHSGLKSTKLFTNGGFNSNAQEVPRPAELHLPRHHLSAAYATWQISDNRGSVSCMLSAW
jgi:hypothetical protein